MKWTEAQIQRAIVMDLFKGALAIVPNCSWTGNECDLLIVDKSLRIIDIEIKISRADFKKDAEKEKWFNRFNYALDWGKERKSRDWPEKVWKHYFAIPQEVWDDSLLEHLPSDKCGVIVINTCSHSGRIQVWAKKRAVPDREARPINAVNAIDIARLASYRMWESYKKIDKIQESKIALLDKIKDLENTCCNPVAM